MRQTASLHWAILVIAICMVGSHPLVWAEDELEFPSTAEEIIKALNQKPDLGPGALQTGGNDKSLFGKGKTRGLGAIADDEEALEQAPKVGALILFDYNSAKIKAESLPLLQEYGKALKTALNDAVLIVAGHTDSKGSEKYNYQLSHKRAEAVRDYLMAEFAIGEKRLIVKPYGEEKPIADNETTEGRARNRRVEFIRIQ